MHQHPQPRQEHGAERGRYTAAETTQRNDQGGGTGGGERRSFDERPWLHESFAIYLTEGERADRWPLG